MSFPKRLLHANTAPPIAALALSLCCLALPARANLVANPSFETDFNCMGAPLISHCVLPGWTLLNYGDIPAPSVDSAVYYGSPAHDGEMVLWIGDNTPVGIGQVIPTAVGAWYDFSFAVQSDGLTPNTFSAYFGDSLIASLSSLSPDPAGTGWTLYHYSVQAVSDSTFIKFLASNNAEGGGYLALDAIDLALAGGGAVPDPCPPPAIADLSLPAGLAAQGVGAVSYTYTAPACNGPLSAALTLSRDGGPTRTLQLSAPPNGSGLDGSATLDGLDAGTYTATLVLTGNQGPVSQSGTLTVAAVPAPVLSVSPSVVHAVVDAVAVTVADGGGSPCPLTGSEAEARADHGKCLVAFDAPPAGLALGVDGHGLPTLTGRFTSSGDQALGTTVSRFGADGSAHAVATSNLVVAVAPCAMPAIAALSPPAGLLPYGSGQLGFAYAAPACNGAVGGTLAISQGGGIVKTLAVAIPSSDTARSDAVQIDGLDAGTYTATLVFHTSRGDVSQSAALTVAALPPPALAATPTHPAQGEDTVTVSLADPAASPCPLTGDDAAAQADPGRCLALFDALPAGLAAVLDAVGLPQVTGIPLDAGPQPVSLGVFRYGPDGQRHRIATASATLAVATAVPPAFALNGATAVTRGVDTVNLSLAQTAGNPCQLTMDLSQAQAWAASGQRACHLTLGLPAGLAAAARTGANAYGITGVPTQSGAQSINYRVDRIRVEGGVQTVASGQVALTVNELPAPSLALSSGTPIGAGRYYAPPGRPLVKVTARLSGAGANAKAALRLTLDAGDGHPKILDGLTPGASVWIPAPAPLALFQEKPVTLRLAYRNYPAVYSEQAVTAVGGVPDAIKAVLDAPKQVADTAPVQATLALGLRATTGLSYDASTLGEWRGWLSAVSESGALVSLTPKTPVDGAGHAAFNVDPKGFTTLKLVASAELVTTAAGVSQRVDSATLPIQVTKGTPIEATLSASRVDGPVPLTATLSLAMTKPNLAALGGVAWQASSDGGTTWSPVPGQSSTRLALRLSAAGRKSYRAVLTNRNTQASSISNPIELFAYGRLALAVSGPAYTAPGEPANLILAPTLAGRTAEGVVAEWITEQPDGAKTGTGLGFTALDTHAGAIQIKIRARPAGTRADDPDAWTQARHRVTVAVPVAPTVAIRGSREVETGKSYHYDGTAKPLWGQAASALALASEWELPDGTVVPGNSLDWTPAADTPPTGKLRYRAWVDGHRADTTATAELAYSAWTYAWPNWTLTGSLDTPRAPATAALRVRQDRPEMARRFEGLRYDWSFPAHVTPGFNVLDRTRDSVSASLDLAGDYSLGVTVSDARGNSTTLTKSFAAQEPTPYAMTLAASYSNPYQRAPIKATVRPTVTGGHPKDRIVGYAWTLDNAPLDALANRKVVEIGIATPGPHVVGVTATSQMGKTVAQTLSVDLAANTPPTCTVGQSRSGSMVTVSAKCADRDGRIGTYRWEVDGVALGSGSDHISFAAGAAPRTAGVQLTAQDDAGDWSAPVSLTVNY